ncbi:hypothetical protein [Nitrosarchaeum koreense]|uniref:Uncharacterized protein n=1 Tax=Nitrosarchaeum koreense MY1 TaxID=1001994 RepID=F9CXS7_9ARCH|nr:hypothetical protein [Nitrosarchaeum koreense]EGP94043.1 hypothetical protein MY1_1285 [Nitrosarchaeum koreense MY1]
MKNTHVIGIVIIVILIIIAIFGAILYYSYTQIHVSLRDASYHSIEWSSFSWSTLLNLGLNVIAGNWLSAAFDLINGINLDLTFGLYNGGLLPVYIPDLSYDLLINNVRVGKGYSQVDTTIYPGQTKEISALQNFKKSSLYPVIGSIVSNGGVINLKVSGTAHFKLLVFDIPIQFESTKSISIKDEIKKKLESEIQRLKPQPQKEIASTISSSIKSFIDTLDGDVKNLDLRLSGSKIVDSTYRVPPGTYNWVSFTMQCTGTVQGGFLANAALGDDIIVYLLDENQFKGFENGEAVSTYYNSGKVESGTFSANLKSGKYYVVMSNSYSIFSTKTVQLQVAGSCR